MNVTEGLAKTVGVIGLGLVVYDSHKAGKHISGEYAKEKKADSLSEHYLDDLKLDSNSTVKMKAKEGIFRYHLDENLTGFFNGITGYAKGFCDLLVSNAIPFGLSVGTLLTKGLASKVFGAGLLAYGGVFVAQEFLGIGKSE